MDRRSREESPGEASCMQGARLGVGLRSEHFSYLMRNPVSVDWFEIISENFIDNHGYAWTVLETLRRDHPVTMHGVSLSVGSSDPLDQGYLRSLRSLADRIEAAWVSDHLCWTGVQGVNTHDLLPLPLNEESLAHIIPRIEKVQEALGRSILLENPSTYLSFRASTIPEWEFLSELCQRTGCRLLLDVNNVYVSAHNLGFDARRYIRSLPKRSIAEIHLAGPSECEGLLVDTHDGPVLPPVWELYHLAQEHCGGVPACLEWDAKIPTFSELEEELMKAKSVSVAPREYDARSKVRSEGHAHA